MHEEFVAGDIDPLPGYTAIQCELRDAWRALRNHGYLPPGSQFVGGVDAAGDAAGRTALDRAATVAQALELRDARGALIPTRWIELTDSGEGTRVSVMAELSIAEAGAVARLRPRLREDTDITPRAV